MGLLAGMVRVVRGSRALFCAAQRNRTKRFSWRGNQDSTRLTTVWDDGGGAGSCLNPLGPNHTDLIERTWLVSQC